MGTWGSAAWENDAAADWFSDLFAQTGLASRIEETLKGDVEDEAQEMRAAASVLIALGHDFVWPLDDLDRHLTLAISRLEEIKKLEEFEDQTEDIDKEIATLKARLKPEVR
jgi:hypothetical protein